MHSLTYRQSQCIYWNLLGCIYSQLLSSSTAWEMNETKEALQEV